MNTPSTKEALLSAAEQLIRGRGYSAFSYADLAQTVGIRKASIHHHFPAKSDLGAALVGLYRDRFAELLSKIDREEDDAMAKLSRYAAIYELSVRQGMLCLCGMLSTEMNVLPDDIRDGVKQFLSEQLRWLAVTVKAGAKNDQIAPRGKPERIAEHVLSTLQGASLVAWGIGDQRVVARASHDLLASLKA